MLPPEARGLSQEAVEAWRSSTLAAALSAPPEDMLQGAFEISIPAGDSIYRLDSPHRLILAVIIEGLTRIYTMSPQGRQVTIRYLSDGDVLGLPVVLAPTILSQGKPLAVQALTPSRLLRLSPTRFREVVRRDPENMWGLFRELARSLSASSNMLAEHVFLPVRSRVARHMLDLATRDGDRLVVHASQQEIANAVGSVREVVSRAILRLRDDELIHRDSRVYVIDSPAGLHAASISDM
jgi:CRP-like cAMP-binding protein